MQINGFIILCTREGSEKKKWHDFGACHDICCRMIPTMLLVQGECLIGAACKRMPVEGDSSIRQESPLCLCVCACTRVCVHALIGGRRAVWYLFVFSWYDLEQHLRLIDQSLCRQTKCGDTSRRLMRCDFWQAGEAVNHHKSHVVYTDESLKSANPFQGGLPLSRTVSGTQL